MPSKDLTLGKQELAFTMNKAHSDFNFAAHGFLCSRYGSFILFCLCKLINFLMVHLKFSFLCLQHT